MTNKQTPAIIHLEFEQKREQRTWHYNFDVKGFEVLYE
jgi:hypothetical protein